jgi:hypothetical protein
MNDEQPGVMSIIAQIQDLSIKDLTWILLETLDVLKSRGIRIAIGPEMNKILVYKKPATFLGHATHIDGAPPIWNEAAVRFTNETLPLTSTKKPH